MSAVPEDRRPLASPACSADEAPRDYMLARPLSRTELDRVLAALRRLEERLGDPERLAVIDRLSCERDSPPGEAAADLSAASALIGRSLPLIADERLRAEFERLRRMYKAAAGSDGRET